MDSAFCKRCGATLPQEDLQEAQEKIAAWIVEGNTAFAEGRIDEALAIATSALESNPNYTEALLLKGLCHERQGDIADALACAEKVVELNPDSELDKIRRNGLRHQLGNTLVVPTSGDRRASLVLAGAAFMLILSVCGAAIYLSNGKQPVAKNEPIVNRSGVPFTNPQPAAQQGPQQATVQNVQQQQQQPPQSQTGTDETTESRPPFESARRAPGLPGPMSLVPDPAGPIGTQPTPSTKPDDGNRPGPDPVPTDPAPPINDGDNTRVNTDPAPAEPSVIDIKVHRQGSGNLGGSTSLINPSPAVATLGHNGVEAMARTGYEQFQLGSYNAAATSFEKALRGGGDPIRLNQRLGQTYDQLGRTSDAASAYRKAVAACQEALQTSKGNKSMIQATLDACRQAGDIDAQSGKSGG